MQNMNFFKIFMSGFRLTFTVCFTEIQLSETCIPLYTAMPNIQTVCIIPTKDIYFSINALNAELILICHFLALLGAHHIFHVSRIRINIHSRFRQQY